MEGGRDAPFSCSSFDLEKKLKNAFVPLVASAFPSSICTVIVSELQVGMHNHPPVVTNLNIIPTSPAWQEGEVKYQVRDVSSVLTEIDQKTSMSNGMTWSKN